MFPQNQLIEFVAKIKQEQMLHEADQARLIKLAKGQFQPGPEGQRPWLAWLGHQLVRLGERLEQQAARPSQHAVYRS